jgi:hypothetical protein
MKECPKCHLVNPDSAVRCDCGYRFQSAESAGSHSNPSIAAPSAEPRKPADIETDLREIVDLSNAYKPSGKFTSSSIPVLLLTAVIACIVVQVIAAITDGIMSFFIAIGFGFFQNNWYGKYGAVVLTVIAGGLGYGFSGYLITVILNLRPSFPSFARCLRSPPRF